jgi:HSP20 family protein
MAQPTSNSTHFVKRAPAAAEAEFSGKSSWTPNTDVYVTDNGLVIKVELAGMHSENLQISADGSKLRISGERPDGCRSAQCSFLVMEINYGSFESVLELPPGYDLAHAKATYLNGFLRLDVPLAEPVATKKTKICVASR